MTPGPVMVDLEGLSLTPAEQVRLRHPAVGGVILFSRNFESSAQLRSLTAAIRALRQPSLLIAVDQEGGRVQRFRHGFTPIPPMRSVGLQWERDPDRAHDLAESIGYVIGMELRSHGVDFSFAPVLDVDYGSSSVIGDRAFSPDPAVIAALAGSLVSGLKSAGVASVGKHFPGHGFVKADSHLEVPVDERRFGAIEAGDLEPYRRLIALGLDAVMPAHVIYPSVDSQPAGFSSIWLKDILRARLGFEGMIFSDDLSMEGASVAGGPLERARAAIDAGCDMVLLCGVRQEADSLLDGLRECKSDSLRIERMRGGRPPSLDARYASAVEAIRTVSV